MSRVWSVSAKRAYGKVRLCRLWGLSRSTPYARQRKSGCPLQAKRRGRRPVWSGEALVVEIRKVLAEAEALGFRGEGDRKVWARLKQQRIPASKERIRRLMRDKGC